MKTKNVEEVTLIRLYEYACTIDGLMRDAPRQLTEAQIIKIKDFTEQLRYELGFLTGKEIKIDL